MNVLHHLDSNNDEFCVALLNGVRIAAFATTLYICGVLKDNFTIHTLSFSRCDLTADDIRQISGALIHHDKLESLDLSSNPIGPLGIPHLAHLRTIPSLIRLDMENTDLGDEGAEAILQHLLHHPTLDALNLARNSIRDGAACILARALARSTLGWLDLSHNQINNNGAQHLLLAQRQRRKFLRLDLHGNQQVSPHILQALTSHNMNWEALLRIELEDDYHEPRPAQPGQDNIPSLPFPTLLRLRSLRARLLESHNARGANPELLWVQQGELPQQVIPQEDDQGDLPVIMSLVPDPGTNHHDVAAWEDITRSLTLNFDESCLVQQTNNFQVYHCQGHDVAATPLEGHLLLRRIDPAALIGNGDRDEAIANFMQRNIDVPFQHNTYVPMLCVVLPQNGNIYQFFHRGHN